MKTSILILGLAFTLLLSNCEQKDCCVIPIESQFHGNWELYKITNGFSQFEVSGDDIGFKEVLIINASQGTFERIRDGKRVVFSKIKIDKEGGNNAIILTNDNSYHWYTFINENKEETLSLYQNCPIGAILADGSNYDYRKVN